MLTLAGNGQLFTTAFAAGSQHTAAVSRRHALTETVFVLALAYGGLESPFHDTVALKSDCKDNASRLFYKSFM